MPTSRRRRAVAFTGASALLASLLAPAVATADDRPTISSAPDDLIISEYVEGSANNKALELYNGTDATIDLSDYAVQIYFNGSTSAGLTVALQGTVTAGEVHVLAHASAAPEILAEADQTNGAGWFNGDDAVVLTKDGAAVDSLGQVGFDPGTRWGTPPSSTGDNTLRRKADVCAGDTVVDDVFEPSLEWVGFPVDTFDGIGSHITSCDGGDVEVFVSEIHYDNDGTDVGEAIEVEAPVGTDLTGWSLVLYNGSNGAPYDTRTLSGVVPDSGVVVTEYPTNGIQNGAPDGLALVDAAGAVVEFLSYEGEFTAVGGPADGLASTDIGVEEGSSTPVGHSLQRVNGVWTGPLANTFGVRNSGGTDPGPGPDPGSCGQESTPIGQVQGSGTASPLVGQTVTVEGTVVGDFQHAGSFEGYYVQDSGDGDPATSDGIFVYARGGQDVEAGDAVRVTGKVSEYYGMTQMTLSGLAECGEGTLPAPVELTLPVSDYEPYEGMLVSFAEDLAILEYYEYGRYGQIVAGYGDETFRQHQPTAVHAPGSPEAEALLAWNLAHRIIIDDGRNDQNPSVLRHPDGQPFSLTNSFRGGDTLSDVTGIIDYRFDEWKVQPTAPAEHTVVNPRPGVPDVGGTTTVAAFNVLNYFTTLTTQDPDARGADSPEELERQQAKIVAAINELDADVVGLMEIENNGDVAVAHLVDGLNTTAGEDRWDFVSTGVIGTDAITTAFIYQPAEVTPVGDYAVLDSSVDERFLDQYNRPALAQTFEDNGTGGRVTAVVNHLKSKGSACDAVGDPTDPDGQGNCNGVRTAAADALGDWANADPTGTETDNVLIIGDLNAYDHEDPITTLEKDGYADLLAQFHGELAYTYVFDGMLGYLDHALASEALRPQVVGAAAWLINADEPSVLDYDLTFKPAEQAALYAPDPYRSSDHDPVLVGLDLTPPDATAPELEVIASPASIWPPNNKWATVDTVVTATDDSGEEPTVTLIGATVTEEGKGRGGDITVVSDSRFQVRAAPGAIYTITYEATDAAGNSTTSSVTVRVAMPPTGGH